MGKKSGKGKEKKLKRKLDQEKLNQSIISVKTANLVEDTLAPLVAFHKYSRNGIDVTIICKKVSDMTQLEIDSVFRLVKDNMQTLYEQSEWGWNEKGKLEEMMEEDARFLMVHDSDQNIVAMCHFRFDIDDDTEVLYCYEIQLVDSVRGKGLGKFLMQILELMAARAKMRKVVLTVFKANNSAVKFFTSLKYGIDDTSPRYSDPLNPDIYDYEIYSKSLLVR